MAHHEQARSVRERVQVGFAVGLPIRAHRLLKEPADYIRSVEEVLAEAVRDVAIAKDVRMGHRVADCRALVAEHAINLVVMNTKDEGQLAMHGLAYPLAIELRDVPLLLL